LAAKDVNDELDYWKEHAPTIEELNEVKEFKKKRYELNVKLSDYWIGILSDMALAHVDRYSDYCNQMKSITPDELQKFVAGLIQQNNRITITMRPQ
jgi:predicted Zn-dependent peptidase